MTFVGSLYTVDLQGNCYQNLVTKSNFSVIWNFDDDRTWIGNSFDHSDSILVDHLHHLTLKSVPV